MMSEEEQQFRLKQMEVAATTTTADVDVNPVLNAGNPSSLPFFF
jgi:hypothetical protein